MKSQLCLFVAFVAPFVMGADNKDDVQKELKALQGKWKAVAMEAGGKALPKEGLPEFTYIVGADGKATGKMRQSEYTAKITIDVAKNPKTIDNLHETGADKGKKQLGIYKLDGDKWTVCMSRPGVKDTERPKSFDTKDTANVVFVFERIKEEKKQ